MSGPTLQGLPVPTDSSLGDKVVRTEVMVALAKISRRLKGDPVAKKKHVIWYIQAEFADKYRFKTTGLSEAEWDFVWRNTTIDCVNYIQKELITRFHDLSKCKQYLEQEKARFCDWVLYLAFQHLGLPVTWPPKVKMEKMRSYQGSAGGWMPDQGVLTPGEASLRPYSTTSQGSFHSSNFGSSFPAPHLSLSQTNPSMMLSPVGSSVGVPGFHPSQDSISSSVQNVQVSVRDHFPTKASYSATEPIQRPFHQADSTGHGEPSSPSLPPNHHNQQHPPPISPASPSLSSLQSSNSVTFSPNSSLSSPSPALTASASFMNSNSGSAAQPLLTIQEIEGHYRPAYPEEISDIRNLLALSPFTIGQVRSIDYQPLTKRFAVVCDRFLIVKKVKPKLFPLISLSNPALVLPILFSSKNQQLQDPLSLFTSSPPDLAATRPAQIVICEVIGDVADPLPGSSQFKISHSSALYPCFLVDLKWNPLSASTSSPPP